LRGGSLVADPAQFGQDVGQLFLGATRLLMPHVPPPAAEWRLGRLNPGRGQQPRVYPCGAFSSGLVLSVIDVWISIMECARILDQPEASR
jgi:hypothetical protein